MYYHISNTKEETRISARKASLSIDLYLVYEITLAETDCFCKVNKEMIREHGRHRQIPNQIVIITADDKI